MAVLQSGGPENQVTFPVHLEIVLTHHETPEVWYRIRLLRGIETVGNFDEQPLGGR